MGAPEWYPFEHEAWALGESVRQVFVRNPRLRKREELLAKVAEVATCRNLRRGRQSFLMALRFVGAQKFASAFARFLDDDDVDGHVVYTLLKMKAPGFADRVAPLVKSDRAWIRRRAKQYVERFP